MQIEIAYRFSRICASYVLHLGRLPDWEGLISFAARKIDTAEIDLEIAASAESAEVDGAVSNVKALLEPYPDRFKVLIFGAYGNGNLGDREMAKAVSAILEEDGRIVCFAYSELATADYPFPEDRKLSSKHKPLNIRVLGLFDALVIGGGGLLSYPHMPLWDPIWKYLIPIPYAIFSCGASSPLDGRLIPLVSGAEIASARDEAGYQELSKYNPNALLCHDPLLAFGPIVEDRESGISVGKVRRLYVLRAPWSPWHAQLKDQIHDQDMVVVFEAHLDFPILYNFPNSIVCSSIAEFHQLAVNFDVVISERYHGLILALLARRPVFGVTRNDHKSKISALLSVLGLADFCFDDTGVPIDPHPYPLDAVNLALSDIRLAARTKYASFIGRLLDCFPASKSPIEPDDSVLDIGASKTAKDASIAPFVHIAAANRLAVDRIFQLSSDNEKLQRELLSRIEEVTGLIRTQERYRIETERMTNEVRSLEDKLASTRRENAIMQASLADRQAQAAKLEALIASFESHRSVLEANLKSAELEKERIRDALNASVSRAEDASKTIEFLQSQCAEIRREKDDAIAAGAEVAAALTALKIEAAVLETAKQDAERAAADMEARAAQTVRDLHDYLEGRFNEFTSRMTEIDLSNREIAQLTDALASSGAREAKAQQMAFVASEQAGDLIRHWEAQQSLNSEFVVQFFQLKAMLQRIARPGAVRVGDKEEIDRPSLIGLLAKSIRKDGRA